MRDADFHGATPSRLRAADLQRAFTGVRSLDLDLAKTLDRCRAYEPLLRAGEAFSHGTAAELFGLPVPASAFVHVISPPGRSQARARGVVGHRSTVEFPVVLQDGVPVVTPTMAWCQLAVELSIEDLVAVGDAIVTGPRRGVIRAPGYATVDELTAEARRWANRRGAAAIARALPRVRVGAESRPETLTRLLLVDAGLPEPLLNDPTPVAGGRVLHPDLKLPAWRLVFEYEGDGHRTDRGRWQRDIRRHRDLEAAGWRVIRVTAHDLFVDPAGFIARVRDHIVRADAARR